jgi:hypothetical protein
VDLDNCFADATRAPPLENLDEELECYLRHVSFDLPSYCRVIVLALICCLFSQVLMLSECQREKRTAESAQVAKNVELEVLAHSQAKKIIEAACADLKREKEHNCWLSKKHKVFAEKAEREKTELVETHAAEVAKLRGYLDLETRSYTEYRQNVHRRLHELHEIVASSFNEVQARCLPLPSRGAKVEEMINWVAGEV